MCIYSDYFVNLDVKKNQKNVIYVLDKIPLMSIFCIQSAVAEPEKKYFQILAIPFC